MIGTLALCAVSLEMTFQHETRCSVQETYFISMRPLDKVMGLTEASAAHEL